MEEELTLSLTLDVVGAKTFHLGFGLGRTTEQGKFEFAGVDGTCLVEEQIEGKGTRFHCWCKFQKRIPPGVLFFSFSGASSVLKLWPEHWNFLKVYMSTNGRLHGPLMEFIPGSNVETL